MTTKLLMGLLPLFTACTIDFEMQLDVGLQEGAELDEILEEGQELFDEMSSNDSSEADESMDEGVGEDDSLEEDDIEETEGTDPDHIEEEHSQICELDVSVPSEVFVGEDILVEWEIHGEPQADTVIALLNETETLHLDFLLIEDTSYMIPSPQEQGEYMVYVGSGMDLNAPDCFVMVPMNVVSDTEGGTEPEIDEESEFAACDIENSDRLVEDSLAVKAGEKLVLEWDTILGEFVEVALYDLSRPGDVILFDVISDDGFYELVVSEDIPRGMYGLSFISVDIDECVHFEIEVIHEV